MNDVNSMVDQGKQKKSFDDNSRLKRIIKVLAMIGGFVGFILGILNFILYYAEIKTRNMIQFEKLLDESWDYLCGENGEPLVGCKNLPAQKIDPKNIIIARRKLEEAKKLDSDNPKILKLESDILFVSGRYKEAIIKVKKAIEADPEYSSAYLLLGNIYNSLGKFDDAISFLQTGMDINPNDSMFNVVMASVYQQKGMINESISILEKGLEADPDNYILLNNIGSYYIEIDLQKAMNLLNRGIILKKGVAPLHHNLGIVYYKKELWDMAKAQFEIVINIDPLFSSGYVGKASCQLKLGDEKDAEETLQLAIATDPENPNGYEVLARHYRSVGRDDDAKRLEERTPKLETDNYYIDRFGVIFHRY